MFCDLMNGLGSPLSKTWFLNCLMEKTYKDGTVDIEGFESFDSTPICWYV